MLSAVLSAALSAVLSAALSTALSFHPVTSEPLGERTVMRHLPALATVCLLLLACSLSAARVYADCPGNLLFNPGFEEGSYRSEPLGTSLSSSLGNGWLPWSILGGATYNREVEYKVLDAGALPSRYHLHAGNSSQKFFTTWGTHTAGFYQRVKVIQGSNVTFSIWVQIYTGQRELRSGGHFISDLEWPKNRDNTTGARVCIGCLRQSIPMGMCRRGSVLLPQKTLSGLTP